MAKYDELIYKMAKQETKALEQLYASTSRILFSAILQILKHKQAAEDILQETYLKIYNNASSFNGGNALAWMITIAKNLAINEYNKRKKTVLVDFTENESLYGEYKFEEQFSDNLALKVALSTLSDTEQKIVLYYNSGLKHREIATIMNLPLGTVTWKYKEALKKLKEELS